MVEIKHRQWYYRGSLKSCNYSCSYCPFSKRKEGKHEAEKDERNFTAFVDRLLTINSSGASGLQYCRGEMGSGAAIEEGGNALLVVPYGEALRHSYYWRELARLSRSRAFDGVGAQTNLSFPVEEMLGIYTWNKGKMEKLRLWCTFHPEMTTVEEFAGQCRLLSSYKIHYCVGAVGIPGQIEELRKLKGALPEGVYFWLNKMDGLGRNYTEKEIGEFLEIDAYFGQELVRHRADVKNCRPNVFVEADGTMRRCNLSRRSVGNLYELGEAWVCELDRRLLEQEDCERGECSCYLAYCNLEGGIGGEFGVYPGYRIAEDYSPSL